MLLCVCALCVLCVLQPMYEQRLFEKERSVGSGGHCKRRGQLPMGWHVPVMFPRAAGLRGERTICLISVSVCVHACVCVVR